MSLLLYLAVLLVSVSSVLFGLDWLAAPAPQYKPPVVVAANHASEPALPPLRHLGSDAAARLTAQPVAPPAIAKAPAAAPAPAKTCKTVAQAQPVIAPPPDAKVNAPPPAPAVAAAEPEAAPADIAAAEPAPEPAPKCDVRACEAAYISFRAEDCTYQPSFGAAPLVREGHAAGRAGGGPGASLGRAVLVSCASLPTSLFHVHRGRLHLSAFERPAPRLHQITPRFEQS